MKRRITIILLLLFFILSVLAAPVSANAPGPDLDGTYTPAPENQILYWALFCFVTAVGIVGTCFLEWLVSTFFDLDRQYGRLILRTNLISQLIMRLAQILMYFVGFRHYIFVIVVLEVLVYSLEFAFYRKKMQGISLKRCLLFTLIANTASLILGLILNPILLHQ